MSLFRGRGLASLITLIVALLLGSRYAASTFIDYSWWSEMHQLPTWWKLLLYSAAPTALAFVIFFLIFRGAFLVGFRRSTFHSGFLDGKMIRLLASVACALLAFLAASSSVENWTVVRFLGGLRVPSSPHEYIDPIFHNPLHFYLFDLPFWNMLLSALLAGIVIGMAIYWLASHADEISRRLTYRGSATGFEFQPFSFDLQRIPLFLRAGIAVLLAALAAKVYLGRYTMLLEDHGQYLVGVDWLAHHVVLPLRWMIVLGSLLAGVLVLAGKVRWALVLLILLPIRLVTPSLVSALYVRPNELALEIPYIRHHIEATRAAYALDRRVSEKILDTDPEIPIDYARHKPLLDNVRLWDWRAFHDTISQLQPLRPYVYQDTDIDRYQIDGQLRQVMMAPREMDIRQVGDAASRWINPHLTYTHGYGVVMAEANRITPDGLPILFIKDAPPVVTSKTLKLVRPEIYYSEVPHEPVFVDTAQKEFNYPSGSESVQTTYAGSGGFPMSSPIDRLAAAVHFGDANILLTEYLTANSRMMIHRPLRDRLSTLAGFLTWDSDPYLVLTKAGHLVWIADGYTSSDAHPYSRLITLDDDRLNYIRNSVKATVDAYTGEVHLYVFDEGDVLIEAYNKLFPGLLQPSSEMPADLREHARYPETLFRIQADIYRSFHMRDPEAFYNRADLWDFAKTANRESGGTSPVSPTYVVATLPGSDKPEFILITTFTPANKDNLIGVMYARCDGDKLGEILFGQLSKQNIIYGPMQVDARVNQDQNISKDLSLWDQRGSQVLRGQMLVLPIDNSFLYVEPIYIQASQASMPQLKKVALAMGNKLAYADTYEQALQQLIDQVAGKAPSAPATASSSPSSPEVTNAPAQPSPDNSAVATLQQAKDHLRRYSEFNAQGKWAEAGKELEELQKLLRK